MASLTGLSSGYFTDIDVVNTIAINGDIGTVGQVLQSDGSKTLYADAPTPATADIITAGTGINITATGNPESVSSNVKSLVLSGSAVVGTPATFNPNANGGSQTITINDTDTTYTATDGVEISGSNVISATIDGDTIVLDGADLSVAKVPEFLTAGTNITYSSGTTFDGSSAVTINATDTDTTYTAGTNLNLSSTTFNLDTTIEDQVNLEFLDNGTATTIVGSDYPSAPTVCTYLDLSSTTNIIPSGDSPFLATKIQETYLSKAIGTAYTEYSSNFRTSFVAQSANALVEFQAVIAAYSKVMYGGLYDYNAGSFWTSPQTQTRFKYDNGVDQDPTTLYWYLTGLTAGTTYYISPYFKSSANYTYIYAGNSGTANSFAPGIFRISDGGSNVSVY